MKKILKSIVFVCIISLSIDFLGAVDNKEMTKFYLEMLKTIPMSEYKNNLDLYKELSKMHPNNAKYKNKVNFYSKKLKEKEKKRQIKTSTFGEKPTSYGIRTIYSPVKRYLKRTMHNPKSLEFVGCIDEVFEGRNGWIVGCDYRGTNKFGGVVTESKWFTIKNLQVIKVEAGDTYEINR